MGTATQAVFRSVVQAVLAPLALVHVPALAGECTEFTSATARPVEQLRLCEHSVNGKAETYACREYRDAENGYVLLFKGGPRPKAIVRQKTNGGDASMQVARQTGTVPPTCRQSPPAGVPATAIHRGTGVCTDANERPVPCSVYEHAAARSPPAMRYMVFYEPHGSGPIEIDAQIAGENENALLAEFAFQLGLKLSNAGCCRAQAEAYLGYAHQLFPDELLYRAAYHEALAHARSETTARGYVVDRPAPAIEVGTERGAIDADL